MCSRAAGLMLKRVQVTTSYWLTAGAEEQTRLRSQGEAFRQSASAFKPPSVSFIVAGSVAVGVDI